MAAMLVDTVDMQNANGHIDGERFAAFDHDALTTDELAHLAGCAACRAESQSYLSLHALSRDAATNCPPDAPRLTSWESLSAGLRKEGLITSPAEVTALGSTRVEVPLGVRARPVVAGVGEVVVSTPSAEVVLMTGRTRVTPMWLRVAAALTLVASGALAGRYSSTDVSFAPTLASTSLASRDTDGFASLQAATEVLYRAQSEYERASLWLASNDSTVHSSDVYRTRLAALDQMMAASRAALRESPQDPVLNHYFLTASAAREATLQALSVTLPVDKTLERY